MKSFSIKLLSTLLVVATSLTFVACGDKKVASGEDNLNANKDVTENNDPKSISGKVKYLTHSSHEEQTLRLVEEFNKIYPNIEIELTLLENGVSQDLTALAATGNLPDVVVGYGTDIAYAVSQGWATPLDEFLEGDKDYEYVPESARTNRVDGKTYGLPYNASTTGIVINLDLLDQLNLDVPDYDWTIDEFVNLAKKATTSKYSGINGLSYFYEFMTGSYDKNIVHWGYDLTTKKMNLTNGAFVNVANLMKDLSNVPGLVASTLKNQSLRDEGKEDDYQKKFGKEVDGFLDGKILFANLGLWDLDWLNPAFNFDFYPYPTAEGVGYRQGVGVDQPFMTVAAEDKEASFEWIKWLTYSPEGIAARYKIREDEKEEGNLSPKVLIPPTTHPEVLEIYSQLEEVPNGVKYILANLDKSYGLNSKGPNPGMGTVAFDILTPKINEIIQGNVEAAAIAPELEEQCNKVLEDSMKEFEQKVKENEGK